MVLPLTDLPARIRTAVRARVSGDPTGAPDRVRDIARVGTGPGWFEPDGAAQAAVGRDMGRFGPRWPDPYVGE